MRKEADSRNATFAQNLKSKLNEIDIVLDKLLDTKLEGHITKEEYIAKKQKILEQKVRISEKILDFEQRGNHWLEPAKKLFLDYKQTYIIALQKNLFRKRELLKKIGSNRQIMDQKLKIIFTKPFETLVNFRRSFNGNYPKNVVRGSMLGVVDNVRTKITY